MANGDDALDAGMDVLTGNEDRREGWDEINKSRDYIAQFAAGIRSIAAGGTGADTAVQALINLGALPRAEVFDGTGSIFGKVPRYDANGRLIVAAPVAGNEAVPLATINAFFANYIARWGGTMDQGHLYLPIASAADSGYTVAYINGDGRLSRGASSRRYKKHISHPDPRTLDVWPDLARFQMRGGDGTWKYGYIAEELAENDALAAFVVYQTQTTLNEETGKYETVLARDETGALIPESIDFIMLLMVQNAQLHARLTDLEARLNGPGDE